eukprot:scaffold2581_cov280-Chaetoceros_neogracile.AAC.3
MTKKRIRIPAVPVAEDAKAEEVAALSICSQARSKWLEATTLQELEDVIALYQQALNAKKTGVDIKKESKKRFSGQIMNTRTQADQYAALSPKDYRKAGERLSLLYLQSGRPHKAQPGLHFLGFTCRLAEHVLNYPVHARTNAMVKRNKSNKSKGKSKKKKNAPPCCILDDFLTASEFAHLQSVFVDPKAAYWTDHNYKIDPPSPYFSHVLNLSKHKQGFLGKLIHKVAKCPKLLQKFPQLKQARYVEMWAHNRPHASGHQLHFDSDDEGKGGVRNPIISTILYLSTSPNIGGPSLITNQRLTSTKLASKGWLAHSQLSRLVAFDGQVLHGVVPGKGVPSSSQRRVTLMMAFWKDIQVQPGNTPGSARPWPIIAKGQSQMTPPSWAADLSRNDVDVIANDNSYRPFDGIELNHVYEHLDGRAWDEQDPMPEYDQVCQGF